MGQYLAIGICTEVISSRQKAAEAKFSDTQLSAQMQLNLGFEPDNYLPAHSGDFLIWKLRPELLAAGLIPLLKDLYPVLYPHSNMENDSPKVLEHLTNLSAEDWLFWAEDKPFYSFQADEYAEQNYIYADFGRKVAISYQHIMLSMEGKIGMEMYGRQFRFFQNCMAKAFSQHQLARSLRVYITG